MHKPTHKYTNLRQRAEELMRESESRIGQITSSNELKMILHELQVHQVELEMQNEELQKAHLFLEEEKKRYKELFEYAPAAYVIINKEGKIRTVNHTFCLLIESGKSEIYEQKITQLVHPDSQDSFYMHLQSLNEKPEALTKIMLKTQSGNAVWVQINSKLYDDGEGPQPWIKMSMININEQQFLRKKLQDEKDFGDKILETISHIVITFDVEGNVLQFNKQAEVFTGYSAHDVIGMKYWELPIFDKKGSRKAQEFFENIHQTTFPFVQKQFWLCKQKERKVIKWNLNSATKDNNIQYIIGFGEDITGLNKKDEHIKRLSTAVEQSANSIVITNLNGIIEYANPSFYKISGYSSKEIIGQKPSVVKHDNSIIDYQDLWQTISAGHIWKGEFLNKRKNGESYWEIGTITPVKNDEGEIISYLAIKEDITQRKQTELEMLKAKNFYLKLLEDFPVMVWKANHERRFDFFNNTLLRFIGASLETPPALKELFWKKVHPKDKAVFADAFKNSFNLKVPFVVEFRLRDKYNNFRWVISHGRPFYTVEGYYAGFIGTCIDIHDRKQAEDRLMESEENYRRMFEDSSLGIFKLDEKLRFLTVNKACALMFGFESPVDFLMEINAKPSLFMPEIDREKELGRFLLKTNKKRVILERALQRKDGSILHTKIHVRKVINFPGDKNIYIEGFIEDITKRKLAEQKLKFSEQKFKALYEKSYDALLITDGLNIIDCNQKAAYVFGMSCDELKLTSIDKLSPDKQPSGHNSKELVGEIVKSVLDDKPQSFYWLHKRKDMDFDAEVSLVKIVINEKPFVQAIVRDVSEKKFAQDQLKLAKEDAEKARSAQSEFLSQMSHEIRTPLNAVVSLTDLVLQDNLTEDQRENLDSVKISARHLLGLIDDILDYNKIESGNIQFENTAFNLRELVSDLNKTLRIKATEKKIQFKIEIDEKAPKFLISDTLRLKQVLFNLLSNGIKFTEKGSVSLIVKTLASNGRQHKILFKVSDTGIGIKKDRLEAIFEKFTQAEVSTSRKFGGSGLGLTISKKIVELLGGEILAESKEGEGSCFSVFLYMDEAESIEEKLKEQGVNEATESIEGVKILMVEDDKMNQFVAKRVIQGKWKTDLTIASSGEEALEILSEQEFELIFMDLLMPGIDGLETTRRIRSNFTGNIKNTGTTIIAFTADAFVETRQKAFEAGVNDFVTKPFDYESLFAKIFNYTRLEK